MTKPHIADPDYLRTLIDDEVKLAGLLRYNQVKAPSELSPQTLLYPKRRDTSGAREAFPVPQWRRDWSAAGPLLGKYGMSIAQSSSAGTTTAFSRSGGHSVTERLTSHPDAQLALMAAIVRTLILCLEGGEQSK